MKTVGKRGVIRIKARKIIADYCQKIDLNYCENPKCKGNRMGLAPAHKENLRFYRTVEEMADPKNWVALCGTCHQEIESNKRLTDDLFSKLRP